MRYVSLLEPLALHGMGDRRNEDTAQLAPYRAVVRLAVPAPLAVLVDPSDFACAALVGVVTTLVTGDFGNDGVAEMYIEVANAYLGCDLRHQGFIYDLNLIIGQYCFDYADGAPLLIRLQIGRANV